MAVSVIVVVVTVVVVVSRPSPADGVGFVVLVLLLLVVVIVVRSLGSRPLHRVESSRAESRVFTAVQSQPFPVDFVFAIRKKSRVPIQYYCVQNTFEV